MENGGQPVGKERVGHLPTTAELRMRRRTHPEFPSDNVFSNRFGNKTAIARRLLDFADAGVEFADVAEVCAKIVEHSPVMPQASRAPEAPIVTGVVYLIRMGEFHKIGKSNDPGRRMYELAISLPEKHDVEHLIETDDPSGIEAYWHRRFAAQRANGEWFRLAPGDITAFKRRAYM
jgi:hypothetical protein